jgi:hypothetical protein
MKTYKSMGNNENNQCLRPDPADPHPSPVDGLPDLAGNVVFVGWLVPLTLFLIFIGFMV